MSCVAEGAVSACAGSGEGLWKGHQKMLLGSCDVF